MLLGLKRTGIYHKRGKKDASRSEAYWNIPSKRGKEDA